MFNVFFTLHISGLIFNEKRKHTCPGSCLRSCHVRDTQLKHNSCVAEEDALSGHHAVPELAAAAAAACVCGVWDRAHI